MINVSISLSAKVGSLSPESLSLFCLLIPHFNAHGKMLANPHLVKGLVCPLIGWLTPEKVEACMKEISEKTSVKFWHDEKGIHYLHSLHWTEHQTLKNDRLGPDHLPSWSCVLPIKQDLSRTTPDYSGSCRTKVKGREVEVEEEVKGKGNETPEVLPDCVNTEVQRFKKLHLDTCGLSSNPPMKLLEELLVKGIKSQEIEDIYQLHGGDILVYRQRNIVEKLQKLRDGGIDWDYVFNEGVAK